MTELSYGIMKAATKVIMFLVAIGAGGLFALHSIPDYAKLVMLIVVIGAFVAWWLYADRHMAKVERELAQSLATLLSTAGEQERRSLLDSFPPEFREKITLMINQQDSTNTVQSTPTRADGAAGD